MEIVANRLFVFLVFIISSMLTIFFVVKKQHIEFQAFKKKWRIESYFLGALAGAIIIILTGVLSKTQLIGSMAGTEHLNPIGILVLFLSMVFMSVFLDSTGFFEYCARLALKYSGNSATKLFIYLYTTVSILTIFTSNDIIILTFTPFVYYFAKHANINPKPFLIAEFFAANTWSMMLYIGNPTNIIIVNAFNISFMEYSKWMVLPTIVAGLTNLAALYLIFKKDITKKTRIIHENPDKAITDGTGAAIGVVILSLCLIFLSIPDYIGLKMWTISFIFAALLALIIILRKLLNNELKDDLAHVLKRMPWGIVPFVLSLFVIVESLRVYGITSIAGNLFSGLLRDNAILVSLVLGIGSTIAANVFNNIPMTVAFIPVISQFSGISQEIAAFATTIGSNLGANLTPLGALAGIMWMRILKHKDFKISFMEFFKYGIMITSLTLLFCLLTLGLEFSLFR